MNSLKLLLDAYERKARFYPAMLALLPLFCASLALYPVELQTVGSATSIAVYCGVGFFLSSLARARGKAIEEKLYKKWGGQPTTQLLRHRYKDLSSTTRARYHTWLQSLIPAIQMPTEDDEKANPDRADDIYSGCTDWLRERTRDRENFPLVFKELTNYGYARNLLGLKSVGVTLALVGVSLGILRVTGRLPFGSLALAGMSIAVSSLMLLVWLLLVRSDWVKIPAFAYAQALLASLQAILEPLPTSPKH